jgi:N6-adenosine-specific RNA methylase IME4
MSMSYDVIYADPPWPQRKGGIRKSRPNQGRDLDYPVLTLPEIEGILRQYDGRVLFIWTIDKFLWDAERMAKDMGYTLHARIIWDKENGIAPAFTVRFSHEYLLWFYKKPFPAIEKSMRGKYTTVIREKETYHSHKPVKAYEMIEAMYPTASKIELFARERRMGWDAMGNQLDSVVQEVLG